MKTVAQPLLFAGLYRSIGVRAVRWHSRCNT
jgi:hypothetical protein